MELQQTIVVFCSATDVLVTGLCMFVMACRVHDNILEADIEWRGTSATSEVYSIYSLYGNLNRVAH